MATILVVDDHGPTVEHIARLITEAGHRAEFLLESSYLMQKLENDPVDLILLDIYMPDLDGLTLLKSIKANAEYRDIPVIMMTGERDEHLVQVCFNQGAVDFLGKPVHRLELISRIDTALKNRDYIRAIEEQREDLAHSKEFIEAVINSMGDVIVVIDAHSMAILEINRACASVEGVVREQILGESCFQKRAGRHHPCYDCPVSRMDEVSACLFRDTFTRGVTLTRPVMFYLMDGTAVHTHMTATAVRDWRGGVRQVVYQARDDTERCLLEERLRRLAGLQDVLT